MVGSRSTTTAKHLHAAHLAAVENRHATMITSLAVPFVGMEDQDATPVKPDFAIVAPHPEAGQSWLIMGDAKDYERVRSRIDDQRMLKGFLQVALGAESADHWSALPDGMHVHRYGALAVPRNAFLQPEAVVECLDDHRIEVSVRVDERKALLEALGTTPVPELELADFVAHLEATFDPATCGTCAMFNYCRTQVRASSRPADLLIEIGVKPEHRPALEPVIAATGSVGRVPASVLAGVEATMSGLPVWTGQKRIDPAGLPGSIDVVLAKSDGAALGVHGIGVRSHEAVGRPGEWRFTVFPDPQSPMTRLEVMRVIGEAIDAAMRRALVDETTGTRPVHLVIPDPATGDILASIADSLAGVETSRLRWERDIAMGRDALTFDGEPANVPAALTDTERLAVSFLLEEDRGRAMSLRWPLVDLRTVLSLHLVPGGPAVDHGRLDYLVEWAEATSPLDHRIVSDRIAALAHTPGARLSNLTSNEIHSVSNRRARDRGRPDPARYDELVGDELRYKADIVDRAIAVLDRLPDSALRPLYRALEAGSQEVWRRRLELHASDLVRFGRTSWFWRNNHVPMLDGDRKCASQLAAIGSPQTARDMALNAGTREVAVASVVSVTPLRLSVQSRRLVHGTAIVALHHNGEALAECPAIDVKVQKAAVQVHRPARGQARRRRSDRGGRNTVVGPVERLRPRPRRRTDRGRPGLARRVDEARTDQGRPAERRHDQRSEGVVPRERLRTRPGGTPMVLPPARTRRSRVRRPARRPAQAGRAQSRGLAAGRRHRQLRHARGREPDRHRGCRSRHDQPARGSHHGRSGMTTIEFSGPLEVPAEGRHHRAAAAANNEAAAAATQRLLATLSGQVPTERILLKAAAGAGKSFALRQMVADALRHDRCSRVAVAAFANKQVFPLAAELGETLGKDRVCLFVAEKHLEDVRERPSVVVRSSSRTTKRFPPAST